MGLEHASRAFRRQGMKSRGMGSWPAELKPKVPLFPLLFSVAPLHHKGSTETFAGVLDQSSVQFRVGGKLRGGIFALRGGEGGRCR